MDPNRAFRGFQRLELTAQQTRVHDGVSLAPRHPGIRWYVFPKVRRGHAPSVFGSGSRSHKVNESLLDVQAREPNLDLVADVHSLVAAYQLSLGRWVQSANPSPFLAV